MPKEIQESSNTMPAAGSQPGLDLVSITGKVSKQDWQNLKLVTAAGVTGGLTELAVTQMANNKALKFGDAALELMGVPTHGPSTWWRAADALREHQTTSILKDIPFEKGPLGVAANEQIGKVVAASGKVGDAMRSATMAEPSVALTSSLGRLQREATVLNQEMYAHLTSAESSGARAFGRGFVKGAGAMAVGIGAGYMLDHITGLDDKALNSPLGAAMDAGAGLILLSNMPARYKVPLMVAAVGAPRILQANGYGDFTNSMDANSLFQPNAVDALGLGVAAGMPVDGRTKLAIGAGALAAGRVYNIVRKVSDTASAGLDSSIQMRR